MTRPFLEALRRHYLNLKVREEQYELRVVDISNLKA